MERLTEERLQSHIDECNHRINKINDFILNNVGANQEECAYNIAVLVNAVNAIEEYKKYKILEEQGKLLKLPCAVGDTYYRIENDGANPPYIREWEVRTIEFCVNVRDSIGKTVFLTKEEAEEALKNMTAAAGIYERLEKEQFLLEG